MGVFEVFNDVSLCVFPECQLISGLFLLCFVCSIRRYVCTCMYVHTYVLMHVRMYARMSLHVSSYMRASVRICV